MPRLNALQLFRLCANALEEKGFSVQEEIPNETFIDEMKEMGKINPSLPMLPMTTDLTAQTSFWLSLRRNGELIGTVAARIDDLGECGAEEFMERSLRRYWCTDPKTKVSVSLPYGARSLAGPTIYMGDFFFKKGETGDPQKTFCFTHSAHAWAFSLWPQARNIYAFTRMADHFGQKTAHYGFTSGTHYNIATWENPPAYRSEHECLCLLSRRDFSSNASALVRNPELIKRLPERLSRD